MRLGIAIEETWDFFHDVYADLSAHHQTTLYRRPAPRQLPLLNGRWSAYRLKRDLEQFLARQDAVFFEWASELLALASRMPGSCALVTRLHRYELYKWADQIDWRAVDRLILVSEAKRREFAALRPEHAHKAIVIPEAVSVQRFQFTARRFEGQIGILCHMKPRKRVYELVLAFHELLRHRPDFHLHIGGGRAQGFGEYDEAIRQLVDRLGLRDKVTFHGHVAKPEAWYPLIDVFVSNGYSEGLQVSALEAMASGCYCLSHHWDGADELLPPANLFFTNGELVQQLLDYAALPEDTKLEARARMRAIVCERFDVEDARVRIRRVVEEAAAARAARACA